MTTGQSRQAVQTQAERLSRADQLRSDDAYPRFAAPASSTASRAEVQAEAVDATRSNIGYARWSSSNSFIGGM